MPISFRRRSASAADAGRASGDGASSAITSAAVNPQHSATIAFTDGNGNYDWALRDRTSNALVASGTGTWQAGTAIALNGFELTLDGVPAGGDSFAVTQTAHPQTNNGNALALAATSAVPTSATARGTAVTT